MARTEPWLQAGKYAAAVMSQIPKRNGWTIAAHAGDRAPDKTQRLLNRVVWNTFAVTGVVRPDQPPPAEFGMIPLTVPKTGRLLSHPPPPGSAGHWLDWRRRRQARSRWYHKRTRIAGDAGNAPAS